MGGLMLQRERSEKSAACWALLWLVIAADVLHRRFYEGAGALFLELCGSPLAVLSRV